MTLDDRLRDAGARVRAAAPPAPPLEDFLPPRPRRRVAPAVLAAAAVVLVTAGVAVGAAVLRDPTSTTAGGSSTPFETTAQPTSPPAEPCANLALDVAAGSQVTPVPIRGKRVTLAVDGPAEIVPGASGGCADQVNIALDPGGSRSHARGDGWTITRPGRYLLRYTIATCAGIDQPGCIGGLADLAMVTIEVR